MHIKSIFTVYHFDAMFNMESAIPDHSQLFETFALKNCLIFNLSKGMYVNTFSGSPDLVSNIVSKQ